MKFLQSKHIAAGGIGYTGEKLNTSNCTIKNVTINNDWEEPENIEDVVELLKNSKKGQNNVLIKHATYAGFLANANEDPVTLDGIKVSNVQINGKYASIGGIYAYAENVKEIR